MSAYRYIFIKCIALNVLVLVVYLRYVIVYVSRVFYVSHVVMCASLVTHVMPSSVCLHLCIGCRRLRGSTTFLVETVTPLLLVLVDVGEPRVRGPPRATVGSEAMKPNENYSA